MRLHRSFGALVALVALAACEKNAVQDITSPLPTAAVRFFNWGVNAPAVHFYSGDEKLSATLLTTCSLAKNPPVTATDTMCLTVGTQSTAGIAFGGVSGGALYTGITPGQHTFEGRIMAAGADNGLAVSSVAAQIEEGKYYSVYQSGFYNTTTKTADAFIVEDNFPANFDWSAAYVRFVNGISNSAPMTLFITNNDVTADPTPIAIGGSIPYKSAGEFIRVPVGNYNLYTRVAGGTTDAIARTNVGFTAGRTYTITSRGDMTVTSTTATNRPFLDNTLNR